MKLAHFGTFDVENYGDLLFPLLLERRLSGLCDRFVHVSPRGGPPPWNDCVETIGFDQFSRQFRRVAAKFRIGWRGGATCRAPARSHWVTERAHAIAPSPLTRTLLNSIKLT